MILHELEQTIIARKSADPQQQLDGATLVKGPGQMRREIWGRGC